MALVVNVLNAPDDEVNRRNFERLFGLEMLQRCRYQVVKKFDSRLVRHYRSVTDRRTDGRTDGQTHLSCTKAITDARKNRVIFKLPVC